MVYPLKNFFQNFLIIWRKDSTINSWIKSFLFSLNLSDDVDYYYYYYYYYYYWPYFDSENGWHINSGTKAKHMRLMCKSLESVFSVFGKRFRESNFDYDDFRFQITNLFVIIIINNILIKFILIFGSDPADRPYTGWCPFIIRFNRIQRCLNSEPIWTESVG